MAKENHDPLVEEAVQEAIQEALLQHPDGNISKEDFDADWQLRYAEKATNEKLR